MEKTELDEERDMVNVWHTRATAHQGATENAEKALAAMTAERGQLVSLVEGLHRQLNEMTAAKELTERQVEVLCKRMQDADHIDGACNDCPASCPGCGSKCAEAIAAWSRVEAAWGQG